MGGDNNFDAKLTVLSKQFHFLDVAIVSDILNSVECDVEQAAAMIAAMCPAEEDTLNSGSSRPESDEELQQALEESRQENHLLKIVARNEAARKPNEPQKNDMTKSPDPPPPDGANKVTNNAPSTTQPMNFASKAALPANVVAQTSNNSRLRNNSQSENRIEVKDGFNLYIMRGLPGSGKSTLAKRIQQCYMDVAKRAVICSADDYFVDPRGNYCWDGNRLPDAHEFCKQKSERHMNMGYEAVIIDNTNIEVWNMIIYATMALRFRYRISIEEPNTAWKLNVRELAKRNKHGCPAQTISLMKQKWEMCTTPDLVKIARNQNANLPPPPALIPFGPGPGPVLINPQLGPFLPPTGPQGRPLPLARIPLAPTLRAPVPKPPPPQNPTPPPQPAPAKQKKPEKPKEKKFQVQVQANVKNIPEAVRQALIPADPVDPVEEKYKAEMRRNQKEHRNNLNQAQGEACLPTDLLDDEDAEDAGDVKITHPPPQAALLGATNRNESSDDESTEPPTQKLPIGHGRQRAISEHRLNQLIEENEQEDEIELGFALGENWGEMAAKLKPNQIPGPVWATEKEKPEMKEQATQVNDDQHQGTIKIVHGNYHPFNGSSRQLEEQRWDRHDKHSQTDVIDEHKRLCEELAELFPARSSDAIARAVVKSSNQISLACEYLLEEKEEEASVSSFELLPEVLSAWNEEVDLSDVDRAFAEFEAANPRNPLQIRDQALFAELASRYGLPRQGYVISERDYACIPAELGRQLYDWWLVTLGDDKTTQELQDELLALELHEKDQLNATTRRLAAAQAQTPKKKVDQDFPDLNPNSPIRHPARKQAAGGQWISKTSLGHREKIGKLRELFPELSDARLTEYLADCRGNVSETSKLICMLTDKDQRDIERRRAAISATKREGVRTGLPLEAPSVPIVEDLGDYDQARHEPSQLFQRANEAATKAAEYHRRGDGLTAGFYSQEAAQLREQAKTAQARTAQAIFAKNNEKYGDGKVIDLHGLHIDEGLKQLKLAINKRPGDELQVITGRGKNSAHGIGKMRKAVESFLHSSGYDFCRHSENQGVLKVKLVKRP